MAKTLIVNKQGKVRIYESEKVGAPLSFIAEFSVSKGVRKRRKKRMKSSKGGTVMT